MRRLGFALLVALLVLNLSFYRFFLRKRGLGFTLRVVPVHIFYYLYSTAAYLVGSLLWLLR